MSDDEVQLAMTLPLDSDGYLRRECPTCEREFKWLHGSDGSEDVTPMPSGGYFCPYCGIQAPPNAWFTKAQVELAQNTVATEVVGPMLEQFGRSVGRSNGPVRMTIKHDRPEKMDPLTEVDDMKRVDFCCHPGGLVKILDDWDKDVYCLVCGAITTL